MAGRPIDFLQSLFNSVKTVASYLILDWDALPCNVFMVPSLRLSTVGGQAFPVAGLSIWNNMLDNVTSAPTLSTFRQRLKTYLFSLIFRDIILD